MDIPELIAKHQHRRDLHITRIMGSLVVVSDGEVVDVDRSGALCHCPLQSMLSDAEVEDYIREKVREFGHFTARREICRHHHGVPFGASEMMMHALQEGMVDCTITACDGAGTVVTDNPAVVQGVGARMNGIFHTSPIADVLAGLRREGARVWEDAAIDQLRGLQGAIDAGHRRVVLTVNGFYGEDLLPLRELAQETQVDLTLAGICTTGVSAERAGELAEHCDVIWSCASKEVRSLGAKAILQLTHGIPVFFHTERGLAFLAAYSDDVGGTHLRALKAGDQYLLAGGREGREIHVGERVLWLRSAALPVLGKGEPEPLR